MKIIELFPVSIFIDVFEGDLRNEFEFVKNQKTELRNIGGNYYSYNKNLLFEPELLNIKIFIQEKVKYYLNEYMGTSENIGITQSWLNKNPPKTKHHEHFHANSILSGVFYFQENCKITFINNNKSVMNTPLSLESSKSTSIHNSNSYEIQIKNKNALIIFPSFLVHKVEENTNDIERYSLAFNTFVTGKIGNKDNLTEININGDLI